MNDAHETPSHSVRARGALSLRTLLACVFGCALGAAAGVASGQSSIVAERGGEMARGAPREREPQPPQQRIERAPPTPRSESRLDPRQTERPNSDGRDEQRRMRQAPQEQAAHSVDPARRGPRMSADERRDLRRQINETGQDIYANTPRR